MAWAASRLARSALRILVALTAGVAIGSLLVAAYIYSSLGTPLVFEGLFEVGLLYGAAIAAFCVPIWLVLVNMRLDRALFAAALGFVATATFLVLTTAAGSHPNVHLMAYSFLPYAVCGAVAALVTWWTGRVLERRWRTRRP
jgi:hypothetical protein